MSHGLRLNLHVQVLFLKHIFLCSSAIMLVLEKQIYLNTIYILWHRWNITHMLYLVMCVILSRRNAKLAGGLS